MSILHRIKVDTTMTHVRVLLCLFFVVTVVGCSSDPTVVPVSGQVTLNKKPLANAWVSFVPINDGKSAYVGTDSIGRTDEQGRYTLRLSSDDRPGAVVGEHRVSISIADALDDQKDVVYAKERKGPKIPAKYQGPESKLTITIPEGGKEDANFDLTSR